MDFSYDACPLGTGTWQILKHFDMQKSSHLHIFISLKLVNHSSFGSKNLQFLSKPAIHSHMNTPYNTDTTAPHHVPLFMLGIKGRQMIKIIAGSLGAMRINRELMTRVLGASRLRFKSEIKVMQAIVMLKVIDATHRA